MPPGRTDIPQTRGLRGCHPHYALTVLTRATTHADIPARSAVIRISQRIRLAPIRGIPVTITQALRTGQAHADPPGAGLSG